MAYEFGPSLKVSRPAGADLTTAQYKFVKLEADGDVILCTALTDRPLGVLQNTASTGQIAEVLIAGGTKVLIGTGGVSTGNPVFVAASATGITDTVGDASASAAYVLGTYLEDGAAGAIATAVINCANSARGA